MFFVCFLSAHPFWRRAFPLNDQKALLALRELADPVSGSFRFGVRWAASMESPGGCNLGLRIALAFGAVIVSFPARSFAASGCLHVAWRKYSGQLISIAKGGLSPSFQGSFFSGNHQTPSRNSWLLKRTMFKQNGESNTRNVETLEK